MDPLSRKKPLNPRQQHPANLAEVSREVAAGQARGHAARHTARFREFPFNPEHSRDATSQHNLKLIT